VPRPTRAAIHAAWRERIGPVWTSRAAAGGGAVVLGLVALLFARMADMAQEQFDRMVAIWPYAPLAITPAGFVLIVWLTRTLAPEARGSGIPQVIAAANNVEDAVQRRLISLRTSAFKLLATVLGVLCGAAVGREGPTVQIGASIMVASHRLFRVPLNAAVMIAGGAAGVAAAFNTPIAGVAFAIEELASAYEQRLALLVMGAVMVSGLVTLGLAGDYVYFGVVHGALEPMRALPAALLIGIVGGVAGGLFSRMMLFVSRSFTLARRRPLLTALVCGLCVALIGVVTGGLTWGTGYSAARTLVEGGDQPIYFAPAKFAASLLTASGGLPGGIFAPSLSIGAGLGGVMHDLFPEDSRSAIVLLGMIAYFVGVVRAPLTAVVIVSEMTADRAMILPLFAAAIIADGAARLVCKERLYHGLAAGFAAPPPPPTTQEDPPPSSAEDTPPAESKETTPKA
jgi:H+/Cl- antiporter ClcA